MKNEQLENRLFYSAVESLGENPSRNSILQAYDLGVKEAQAIADQGINATREECGYGIKSILEDNEMWYHAFIKGYQHFAIQGVDRDLEILCSNVSYLLHKRDARIKNESDGWSKDTHLGQDLRQKERRNVDFYQSVLDLGNNPSKRKVNNTFLSWCEEADSMVDEFLQVDLEEQFEEYHHEIVRWRHAFIKGYQHFVKYDLNEEISNLFSKTMTLVGIRKGIVCYEDNNSRFIRMRDRKKFDREVKYRTETRMLGEKWRLQNETSKE